jgi:hypothetical protein
MGEHQEHFPDGPLNGKGKDDNGLKAKNKIFVRAKIQRNKNDQSDVTDNLMLLGKIFITASSQTLVKSVIDVCIRVSINFPEANKVMVSITGHNGNVKKAKEHIASWISQVRWKPVNVKRLSGPGRETIEKIESETKAKLILLN